MKSPDIRGAIRSSLAAVFLVSLVIGSAGFYLLLRDQALQEAAGEARLMLTTAIGVRDYTNAHIAPLAAAAPAGDFHEESVPFFAAQTVFRSVSAHERAFTYREAALNPTAPADRASDFEVGLIQRFAADPQLAEVTGDRSVGADRVFYVARPIRIADPACLSCHDTPARAPPAMLAKYGPNNGFGWKLGEVVGVQWLALPVTAQFRQTLVVAALVAAGLSLIFLVAYLALSASLEALVARPLTELARAADKASLSAASDGALPSGGVAEVGRLSLAIQRLRSSLAKAMAELERRGS